MVSELLIPELEEELHFPSMPGRQLRSSQMRVSAIEKVAQANVQLVIIAPLTGVEC